MFLSDLIISLTVRLRRGVEGRTLNKIMPVVFLNKVTLSLNCTDSETKNIHVLLSFRSRFHRTAELTATTT